MDINFELYRIFYFAGKYKNFSEAGKKLFISQSAVSQAIRNLEDKTGTRLFYRKSRNVSLTPEGELLFKHIEKAYNLIKSGESKLMEIQNLKSGEIRIGAGDTICRYFLIPYLREFMNKYPGVKVQVINRTSSQIIDLLKNGVIEVGIPTLPIVDNNINVIDFIEVEDVFAASDKFSQLRGRKVGLSELMEYPLLLLQRESATRRNLDYFLLERGLSVKPELEFESIELLVEFARIGAGIAHVLKESALTAFKKGELFEVKLLDKLPKRKLGIASVKNVPLSRAAEAFVNLLYKKT
ncbi:MAG TPA: LysR family transcriptional regulator [Clostridiaceae bacterium]|nr:LysR family transcriptional regulator [Clostridiaceae bacterium]